MKWKYNDGGRRKYFKSGAQDCVCRSIAIATGRDYMEIYRLINETFSSPFGGVYFLSTESDL